jgi:hypothetical protein
MAGKSDIPGGLWDPQFRQQITIEGFLKLALADLQKADANVKRVTSRLNYSNTIEPIPVWAGTWEDQTIQVLRRYDAGKVRFGRSNRSKVYNEAVMEPQGRIIVRDWRQALPEKSEDGYGPGEALGARVGCSHQLFIALRINDDREIGHIGTLTVGLDRQPNMNAVRPEMEKWAWEEKGSKYVEYLKTTFNLGGPSWLRKP